MVSLLRTIFFYVAASISMLTGAQCVHVIYRPLDDLEDLVQRRLEQEREKLRSK